MIEYSTNSNTHNLKRHFGQERPLIVRPVFYSLLKYKYISIYLPFAKISTTNYDGEFWNVSIEIITTISGANEWLLKCF